MRLFQSLLPFEIYLLYGILLKLFLLSLLLVRCLMTKHIAKFTFHEKAYPIIINWSSAYNVLPEKFDINILKLFVNEEETQKTISNLLNDDDLALRLCWFYLEPHVSFDWDKFLQLLDEELEAIENFREAFWAAVVNFSSPQKKGVLLEMWKIMKREMRQLSLESQISSKSSTESSPEVSE